MVLQNPMTCFDPLYRIGSQMAETFAAHTDWDRAKIREISLEVLEKMRIHNPEEVLGQYPHQLSGGMLQRIMIAMALSCDPQLLIADECTTALDVTTQAQILDLMKHLQETIGMSILFITHNFGVVAEICDRASVMYAGKIVETSTVEDLFDHPKHPYTKALIESIPKSGRPGEKLVTIPGAPPSLVKPIKGCAFAERCQYANENCKCQQPEMIQVGPGHECACFLSEGKVE